MITAVFFDLYETLITEFAPAWRPRPSIPERLGIDEQEFQAEWKKRWQERITGIIPDYPGVLREICRSVGKLPNESVIEQLHKERLCDKATPFGRIANGVIQALESIRDMNMQIGLISNCAPEEVAAWETCRLAPFFDDVVFSYQVGFCKPDSRIYHLASSRLGVSPEQSLFVGDGGSDELTGAAQVGMMPYWATWFIDCWPAWKHQRQNREQSCAFPRLTNFGDLVEIVATVTTSDNER
ncbi:HAD family hydrolase [Candidatus Poribacteria bacterium]|nr:HAD family hydrolase [Candidatus Poribacteria bacterium]